MQEDLNALRRDIDQLQAQVASIDSAKVETSDLIDLVYPVNSIYMSVNSTSPATLFGKGTWVRLKDKFLLGAGDTYINGNTGGAATVTLGTNEIPAHTHGSKSLTGSAGALGWTGQSASGILSRTYTNFNQTSPGSGSSWGGIIISADASHTHDSVGGSGSHNNLPPYLVVYMWKRTA